MNSDNSIVSRSFSLSSPMGRDELLRVRNEISLSGGQAMFELWADHMKRYVDLAASDRALICDCNLPENLIPGVWTFCAQTLSAVMIDVIDEHVGLTDIPPGLFDWYRSFALDSYRETVANLRRVLPLGILRDINPTRFSDLLGHLFQAFFPASLRHLLGEYYTPSWVVGSAANLLDFDKRGKIKVFDPAAGSGGFVVQLVHQLMQEDPTRTFDLTLADVNPVALRFGHSNLRFLASKDGRVQSLAYYLSDTIIDEVSPTSTPLFSHLEPETVVLGLSVKRSEIARSISKITKTLNADASVVALLGSRVIKILEDRFRFLDPVEADIICGNPPWISWDGLYEDYRKRLSLQWSSSLLITASGWRSRVAAGKQDVSALFVYRCAERHCAPNAKMVLLFLYHFFRAAMQAQVFGSLKPVMDVCMLSGP